MLRQILEWVEYSDNVTKLYYVTIVQPLKSAKNTYAPIWYTNIQNLRWYNLITQRYRAYCPGLTASTFSHSLIHTVRKIHVNTKEVKALNLYIDFLKISKRIQVNNVLEKQSHSKNPLKTKHFLIYGSVGRCTCVFDHEDHDFIQIFCFSHSFIFPSYDCFRLSETSSIVWYGF